MGFILQETQTFKEEQKGEIVQHIVNILKSTLTTDIAVCRAGLSV